MSLDTALTIPQQEPKTEIRTETRSNCNGNSLKTKSPLRFGKCPHYDDCQSQSKAENYYCLESRCHLVMSGKIICYKPKE